MWAVSKRGSLSRQIGFSRRTSDGPRRYSSGKSFRLEEASYCRWPPKTAGSTWILPELHTGFLTKSETSLWSIIDNPDVDQRHTKLKGKFAGKSKVGQKSSKETIVWTDQHQDVLENLPNVLIAPPVMAFPDHEKPFIIHTDASNEGLGAVLYQKLDEKMRVIAYGSRTLSPAEKNYYLHSGKLEFLALKWAVTEKFRDYLYYSPSFTVYTDNNPLTYVLSTARLNATGHRWVAELADFNFTIKYRPGRTNADADTLSRMPINVVDYMAKCTTEVSPEELDTTVNAIRCQITGESISQDLKTGCPNLTE